MKKHVIYSLIFVIISGFFISGFMYSRPARRKKEIAGMHDIAKVPFDERVFSENRKVAVRSFVERAAKYLETNELSKSLHAFSHSKDFIEGEIYLFVYDYKGFCLAHGESPEYIWQNRIKHTDVFGTAVVEKIIEKAKRGGGWINYQRRSATKVSYVRMVEKNGKRMVVGAGFYPLSKKDAVIALVKGAVEHFNKELAAGESPQSAFSEFSYPLGKFVLGDLYLFALDFRGNMMAQGDRPGLIGTNAINYKDEKGKFVNREIIEKLMLKERGIWVEYVSKGASKRTYAEQVIDKKGGKYFIACGYYPNSTRAKVVDLVKRGYTYMEKNGITAASNEFSARGKKNFRHGDLWLFVYDYKGKCIAHGTNRDYIGTNRYDVQDQDGRYYVREFIEAAKGGGGWIDYKIKNSFVFVYVEEVEIGAEKYVIGSGLFPISKPESMQLLVKGASGQLRDMVREEAFAEFTRTDGSFVKGDIEVFVFDFSGLCYVYGSDTEMIWKDMLNAKDEDGRPFVKLIINTAKEGSGTVVYKENKKLKTAYVMKVEKDGKSYAVGSSFFTK